MAKIKKRQTHKLSPKTVRIGAAIWVVAVLGLLVFSEVVRPNLDAKAYTQHLDSASKPLEQCFNKLSATTSLNIYYAPDISLDEKKANLSAIRQQITSCRRQLASFNQTAHQLMGFRLAGYTSEYRNAQVNQRQAYDVVGQSTDVMAQYDRLAGFLQAYYGHISIYLQYTDSLSKLNTYYITSANSKQLADQAADLQARADAIRNLDAPEEFNDTKQATADMFAKAATGFDNVAYGYSNAADYYTTTGFAQVDDSLKQYDSTVINLPFEELTASYIPKQVQQLPVKVTNLLASQSE